MAPTQHHTPRSTSFCLPLGSRGKLLAGFYHDAMAYLVAFGYSGVRDYRARFRGNARIPVPALRPPNPRTVTAWITTRPGAPDPAGKDSLEATLVSSPELAAATAHVQAFAALMTGRRGRELEHWMTAAAASGEPSLQSFVTGLRVGQDSVTVGPTLQRSPGSVQGHVSRIKALNRQIYGRASSLVIRSAVASGHA